ncbi:hypothetical protein DMB37_04215 [Nocardia sp. CS682]|nr:hypothetical protein DMB37_04215 [Nocardia sp. CS682]
MHEIGFNRHTPSDTGWAALGPESGRRPTLVVGNGSAAEPGAAVGGGDAGRGCGTCCSGIGTIGAPFPGPTGGGVSAPARDPPPVPGWLCAQVGSGG